MTDKTIKFFVEEKDDNKRLDIFLVKVLKSQTRSNLKKMIKNGNVLIDGKKVFSASKKIKFNNEIQIVLKKEIKENIIPAQIDLDIIYEDEYLLVINKPPGMVVHPGAGNIKKTLVNALMHHYKNSLSNLSGEDRPGIVHRIDKDTSGLVVVAKNNFIHSELSKQFSNHSITRKYLALIWGSLRPLSGKIETFISRDIRNRQLMSVSESKGKRAITNFKTLKVYQKNKIPKISLVEFSLETGRTHQIRVHVKFKKTSILGDKKYGKKIMKFKNINAEFEKKIGELKGQMLHATQLGFKHPEKNQDMMFNCNPPEKFKNILEFIDKIED